MIVALPLLAFFAGAYLALTVRALIANAAHRRMQDAARDALTVEQFEHLREYLDEIDRAERDRMTLVRDGGSTVVRLP